MRGGIRRPIDPGSQAQEYAARQQRYTPQHERDAANRDRDSFRERAEPRIVITDVLSFYRENIGDAGNAAYTMRQATPSAAATWGSTTVDAYMGAAGTIIGGRLWANPGRSGGTATLQVQITEGGVATDYLLTDCVLDGVNTQTISAMVPVANGIRFAKGATIRAEVVTAGTWAPTTADASAEVIVAYEGL